MESIKLEKELKIPGLNIILEKGDRILRELDYRRLFSNLFSLKRKPSTWYDIKRDFNSKYNEHQIFAFSKIAQRNGIRVLNRKSQPNEDIFSPQPMEQIVLVPGLGFFYIDTEEYEYARYAIYIPEEIAEKLNFKKFIK
jgi:hypothetical protein